MHHFDRGSQPRYLSIRYTERLADAGIEPSVGSVGDSCDLAETIIGFYKAELIHQHGPWTELDDVECATLEYIEWFNDLRILERIGDIPPAERSQPLPSDEPSRRGRTRMEESPIHPDLFMTPLPGPWPMTVELKLDAFRCR